MPLPILQTTTAPTPENLLRLFHRTELHWVRHVGEEAQLDAGVAFTNADMPGVWDGNMMIDAAVPPGGTAEDAEREVNEHFAAAGTACLRWLMNPSAPEAQTRPLVDYLLAKGWTRWVNDVMYLAGTPTSAVQEVSGLTIIPARASFRHARELAEEAAAGWNEPHLAEASMLHLDDPHWDALLALSDGKAVARAGVLAVGDIGRVEHVFVSEPFRKRGIGRTMMSRVLEICARSLFKHVMLCVNPTNRVAIDLYEKLGFRKIGQMTPYIRRA